MLSKKILGMVCRKLRNNVLRSSACHMSTIANAKEDLSSLDPQQVKLLTEEMCILVDENDKALGPCSKKDCHLMTNINKGMIHRAFSFFLFNSRGELLIQQRSDAKVTFPGYFANTCCSHPLYTPLELEEHDALGVKRAAQRKLQHELGIPASQMKLEELTYVGRIHYTVPSTGLWGESEIDYILVAQKDVEVSPNPNEIQKVQYVSREYLPHFIESLKSQGKLVSPWFDLIVKNFMSRLWPNASGKIAQDHTIVRL